MSEYLSMMNDEIDISTPPFGLEMVGQNQFVRGIYM